MRNKLESDYIAAVLGCRGLQSSAPLPHAGGDRRAHRRGRVADGMKPLTRSPMPGNPHEGMVRPDDVSFIAPHPPIPADRVRFVGEVVAMVIAETPAAARDDAERIAVPPRKKS